MKRALIVALMLFGCGRAATVPDPQALRGCTGQSVISLEGDRTLTRIGADGVTPLFTFGAGQPADGVHVYQWDVSPNGFAAGVAMIGSNGTNDHIFEVALLGPDGQVRYSERKKLAHTPHILLGADGSLAVLDTGGSIIHPDGTRTDLGELQPMTPVLADGSIIVARGAPWEETSPKGVWKDGAFRALSLPAYPELQVVGGRVLRVDGAKLTSVLDGVSFTLPSAGLQLVSQAAGRYVLLVGGENVVVRVDLELGTVQSVAGVASDAPRYGVYNTSLHFDGSVLSSTVHGEQLQLTHSTDLGSTWSDLGEPMARGVDFGLGAGLHSFERGGSLLAVSLSTGYGHYVNEVQLVSPSGAHRVNAGGIYVNNDLSPSAADLSPDGQCAATWVQPDNQVEARLIFFDAAGNERMVHTALQPGWFRFVP